MAEKETFQSFVSKGLEQRSTYFATRSPGVQTVPAEQGKELQQAELTL